MQNKANPEFRKIPSLKFLYEINSNGTIIRNVKSKKQLKIRLDCHHSKAGYYVTFVHMGGRKHPHFVRVMIHQAVAECWYGPCPEGMEVDHIDRNTHNNDYRNLCYVTHSQQMKNRELSGKTIQQATSDCLNYSLTVLARPVTATDRKTGEAHTFRSFMKCAEYIAEVRNTDPEKVRYKLKRRSKYILGFDIDYQAECRD